MEELGCPAHRNFVLQAWRLHQRLTRVANREAGFATYLVAAISIFAFMSVCVAASLLDAQLEGARADESRLRHSIVLQQAAMPAIGGSSADGDDQLQAWLRTSLSMAAVLLPLLTGSLVVLLSRFAFLEAWARAHLAAAQVVGEIYQFLGGAKMSSADPDATRQKFLERLQDISNPVLLESMENGNQDDAVHDADIGSDPIALRMHVNSSLYGLAFGRSHMLALLFTLCLPDVEGLQANDDPTAPVTAESYMQTRVAPLAKHLGRWARLMSARRSLLGILVFLVLCGASALGALGLTVLIPPALALASMLAAAQRWVAPAEDVSAISRGLSALENLDLHWHGLSVTERGSEETKHRLIAHAEQIALAVAVVVTQVPQTWNPEDDDHDDDAEQDSRTCSKRGGGMTPLGSARSSRGRSLSGMATPQGLTPRSSSARVLYTRP